MSFSVIVPGYRYALCCMSLWIRVLPNAYNVIILFIFVLRRDTAGKNIVF